MLDDRTSDPSDLQLHSIAHGVISLEQSPRDFGAERRRASDRQDEGIEISGGYHDFILDKGGLSVFPRLVASEHHLDFSDALNSTGSKELDALLGGGLTPGTNTLLIGPSGVGKTTTAIRCMLAALERGAKATYYLFDEGLKTLLTALLGIGNGPSASHQKRGPQHSADRPCRAFARRIFQPRPRRGRTERARRFCVSTA